MPTTAWKSLRAMSPCTMTVILVLQLVISAPAAPTTAPAAAWTPAVDSPTGGPVQPLQQLPNEILPEELNIVQSPSTTVTVSFNMIGTSEQDFVNSYQPLLTYITANITGTQANQWQVQYTANNSSNGSAAAAAAAGPQHNMTVLGNTTAHDITASAVNVSAGDGTQQQLTTRSTSTSNIVQKSSKNLTTASTQQAQTDKLSQDVSGANSNATAEQQTAPATDASAASNSTAETAGAAASSSSDSPNRRSPSSNRKLLQHLIRHRWAAIPATRKLLQQQQQARDPLEVLHVTLSVNTADPELVTYRLTRPSSGNTMAARLGCSTQYCYMLVAAGVPVDSSSIQISPDLSQIMSMIDSSSLSKVADQEPRSDHMQRSVGPALGGALGGAAVLLLLLYGAVRYARRRRAAESRAAARVTSGKGAHSRSEHALESSDSCSTGPLHNSITERITAAQSSRELVVETPKAAAAAVAATAAAGDTLKALPTSEAAPVTPSPQKPPKLPSAVQLWSGQGPRRHAPARSGDLADIEADLDATDNGATETALPATWVEDLPVQIGSTASASVDLLGSDTRAANSAGASDGVSANPPEAAVSSAANAAAPVQSIVPPAASHRRSFQSRRSGSYSARDLPPMPRSSAEYAIYYSGAATYNRWAQEVVATAAVIRRKSLQMQQQLQHSSSTPSLMNDASPPIANSPVGIDGVPLPHSHSFASLPGLMSPFPTFLSRYGTPGIFGTPEASPKAGSMQVDPVALSKALQNYYKSLKAVQDLFDSGMTPQQSPRASPATSRRNSSNLTCRGD